MVFTVTYDALSNIKLVKAVEKYPVLYNNAGHPFRKTIDEAWEKVAQEVNDTNVCCKERWLNLRNSYKRYLRQKQNNLVKKPYYLADHMEFLEPFITLSGPSKSDTCRKEGENVSDTETSLTPQSPDKDEDEDYDYNDMSIDYLDQPSTSGAGGASAAKSENKPVTSKPVGAKLRDSKVQTLVSYGLRQERTPEENFMKNPDLAFYMSILPEVRRLTESQKKRFRKEVLNAIDNILYAQDL